MTGRSAWNQAAIRAFKTRFYVIALPFAIGAALLTWSIQLRTGSNPFDQAALPALAVWLTIQLVLTAYGGMARREERFMAPLEYLALGGALAFFLVRDFVLLYPWYTEATAGELLKTSPWVPILYLLIFLILPRRSALIVSLTFLLLTFGMGMGHVVGEVRRGEDLHELGTIGQIALSGAAATSLLYILATFKEHYGATMSHAEAMATLALTDFLTGLPNRRQITDVLERQLALAQRYDRPLAVVLIDLDHFKGVNDRFGHDAGDRVLNDVAGLIKHDLRQTDWFSRWGGEEFLVVAPETTMKQAAVLAERLRRNVDHYAGDGTARVTGTFGVAGYRTGDSTASLLKRADEALYLGKARGRNCVQISVIQIAC